MGEISDMMLEGILCQQCGGYVGDGDGFPVTCGSCLRDRPKAPKPAHASPKKRVGCGNCGRVFGDAEARDQHYNQKRRIGDARHQGEPQHKVKT